MRKLLYFIISGILSCIFIACKPYSSDKKNTDLIQGKWVLTEVKRNHDILDTVSVDFTKEQTFLVFEGSKCTQYMPDVGDTLHLTFRIRDYQIGLYKDSVRINILNIDTLTSNLLYLSLKDDQWEYMKVIE